MTNCSKFGITESGNVYLLGRRGRKLLGHIGRLTMERTPLAAEVRAWWRRQMTGDGPIEMLGEDLNALIGPPPSVTKAALAVGEDSDELMEELIA